MLGEWISVNERMPETFRDVIVAFKLAETYIIDIAFWNSKDWSRSRRNVTHWMPLPEPPKEES